jgi:eukaryotic-like serine/threonine-protein kinase
MKLLRRDVARDSSLTERFIHEAKATASIKHPHIVSITDFGEIADGTPYFVMELLVGQTLSEFIRSRGPVPIARAYPILIQIAGALGAAHEAGVVHRDLKPENVFLARRPGTDLLDGADEVKVVDFGAAKVLGASRVTKAGIVFGTPHYMSPEQASGQPVDHRADIYALGVIMYEMLTGRVPFEAETYMGVLTQHMFVQPRPLRESRPELADSPGGLEDIALRALAKKPEDRYQTMNGVRADLERAARGEPCGDARSRPSRPPSFRPNGRSEAGSPALLADPELLASGILPASPRRGVILTGVGIGAGLAVIVSLSWPKSSIETPSSVPPLPASPPTVAAREVPLPAPSPPADIPAASNGPINLRENPTSVPPRKGTASVPATRAPAPSRTSARHSTIPGELSDPWAQ